MCSRVIVIVLALVCFCGCQSSDPYARRSELRKESERIAKAQTGLLMATLDEKVDTTIEGLTSATERNAKSISTLESKLDIFATQNAESLAQFKSDVQASISRNSHSIKQNTQSISLLDSTLNDLVKQTAQSVAEVRTDLEKLDEQVSQFRLDVGHEFSQQQADRAEATDQLVEKTNKLTERMEQLDNRLQKLLLPLAESRQREDTSRHPASAVAGASLPPRGRGREPKIAPAGPSQDTLLRSDTSTQPTYHTPLWTKTENLAYGPQGLYQLSFAAAGLIVVVSGPIVAELYARRQKRLAQSLMGRVVQIPNN